MNVYNTMPGVAEMGMVWMGSGQANPEMPMGMMASDTNDMMLEGDTMYYTTASNHSMSNQSMEDVHAVQATHMNGMENYDMMNFMDIKNESNDSSYVDDDGSQPVYMITTATQTIPCPARKIKPIKHPGLVLKTPIAYQSNTDPSVIPIQKDGIAVCEKCGAIGVKHAFYTRERRFCSMACARGFSGLISDALPTPPNPNIPDTKHHFAKYRFDLKMEDDFTNTYIDQPLPQLPVAPRQVPDESVALIRRKYTWANSFDWDMQLNHDPYFITAPVTCFKHAPMSDIWEKVMVGMKVEVENRDCEEGSNDSFWVATVMRIVGYKAQLRYEGFASNDAKDFWVSMCSNQVHPVGWCATRGKALIPPKSIEDKYGDWKDFLRKRLTGARTLPSNFSTKAGDSLKSRFDCGLNLEVVDKNRISQVKVAIVHKIVGKRLNVKYFDLPAEDAGFWCHEDSPLLHPVGWALKVKHHLVAPMGYNDRLERDIYQENDATDELFTSIQVGSLDFPGKPGFQKGNKLEAIDPLNLSSICVATVMDVLNYGYIMIRIDTYESDGSTADWFCYHSSSPCIFPVGFCEKNNIPLTPPKGYDEDTFTWNEYLKETNKIPASSALFNTVLPQHGFVVGMKIEAADLMDPRLVCVATVAKVVGRLLKVHFDGWDDEYDQWLDCESSDIYPVGWCYSVGHKLEGPPTPVKPSPPVIKSPKGPKKKYKKKKGQNTSPKNASSQANFVLKLVDTADDFKEDLAEELSTEEHGPEAGQEPAGPDQSLPVCSHVDPPSERKATSYLNIMASNNTSSKLIPRLVDNTGPTNESGEFCPEEWNVFDVAQFLRVNDCANYCDAFSTNKIDGKALLTLNKEHILEYTGGKVGPSLKIYHLIEQLKIKINPSQLRQMKSNVKNML